MNVGSSAGPNCNSTHAVQLCCCWETGQYDQVTVSFVDSGNKLVVFFASCHGTIYFVTAGDEECVAPSYRHHLHGSTSG